MSEIKILPARALGQEFVPQKSLPEGEGEHDLRNRQAGKSDTAWRPLRPNEMEVLVKNGVTCDDWDAILVSDPFTPSLIKNTAFSGLVRLGRIENVVLEHHELKTPVGITNSRVIACDLGDNVAVHNVRYLSHFIIGDNAILLNLDEMNTTNHAKFGNGIVKDGEPEEVRIWLDLVNEAGGRCVIPFDGMRTADAYLWAKYRDDRALQERLKQITQAQFDSRRGYYGVVGDGVVIKNSQILKDVKVGSGCYVKGANKLKNLTINSSHEEPTQIGEGVELVNGVIGFGCKVFYGCKAVRFVLGNNASLKYGARLIHSYLGDNSTVSCCEILNNLIFPAHEQHHNNSFLIAALVMGQSNIAAGVTIGSNHNSRAADGEIQAGRGFWPGLCTSLKHSSRFASFVLLAKGDYPAELDIVLPFALVSSDVRERELLVMPAYWWMYNMYALARNARKFRTRDKRKTKAQHIEFDTVAPDTAEEIVRALELLEIWTAKAFLRSAGESSGDKDPAALARIGRQLLQGPRDRVAGLEIYGEGMENARRKTVIRKAWHGYRAYREMLHDYAIKNVLQHLQEHPQTTVASLNESLRGTRKTDWVNFGGQLILAEDVEALLSDIKSGTLDSWGAIHGEYDRLWSAYPLAKQRHAFATLLTLLETDTLTKEDWYGALDESARIQEYICDQVYRTREKDDENRFRQATFRNRAEMESVVGVVQQNSFVKQVRAETTTFLETVQSARQRW